MRQLVREFVGIVSKTIPILEPIFEFGALQVPGQEGFADLRPLFPGKQYVGCDMQPGPGVDLVLDCHSIELPPDTAGTILALDTFEHVEFGRKAIAEFARILKPGGIVVISSVMNFPIHNFPYDYWRFTPEGFRSLLRDFHYSLVDSVGDEDFPHTVVGLSSNCAIPDAFLQQFLTEQRQWKRCWNTTKSWQEGIQTHHYYNYPRPEVVSLVPRDARRVLDVGCATGAIGKTLKEQCARTVVGIELDPVVASIAAKHLDQVIVGDVEQVEIPFPEGHFDCLIMADVLEHLRDPWSTVKRLAQYLSDDSTVICSIPNVRNLNVIKSLVEGHWTYASQGILDRTHLRFFTLAEFQKLLSDAGLVVEKIAVVRDTSLSFPPLTLDESSRLDLNIGRCTIREVSKAEFDEFATVQFLLVAHKARILECKAADSPTLAPASEKQGTRPKVSIIIPVFNQIDYTRQCLEALIENTPDDLYEVIIVDNGSTDGTREFLNLLEGDVNIIANDSNRGFSEACNQGIKAAKGNHILLLNNDVIVTEGWLTRMLHWAESNPDIGIVGPMTNYTVGPQLLQSVPYNGDLRVMHRFARQHADGNAGKGFAIHAVTGFCVLIKRPVIDKIGGMSPRFGKGSFEDFDFCLRASIAGYKIWVAQDVFVHHFGNRTFLGAKIDIDSQVEKNWRKFKSKWSIPQKVGLSQGYPVEKLLAQQFDPQRHFIPLDLSPLTLIGKTNDHKKKKRH